MIAVAVTVFDTDPTFKSVVSVIGILRLTSAHPYPFDHANRPPTTTAPAMPGGPP